MRVTSLAWFISILSLAANAIPIPDPSNNALEARAPEQPVVHSSLPPAAHLDRRAPVKKTAPKKITRPAAPIPVRPIAKAPTRLPARPPTRLPAAKLPAKAPAKLPTTQPPAKKLVTCDIKKAKAARKPTTGVAPRPRSLVRRVIDFFLAKRAPAEFTSKTQVPSCTVIQLTTSRGATLLSINKRSAGQGNSAVTFDVTASDPAGFAGHFVKVFNIQQKEIDLNKVLGLHVADGEDQLSAPEIRRAGKEPARWLLLRPQQGRTFENTQTFARLRSVADVNERIRQCNALIPGLKQLIKTTSEAFTRGSRTAAAPRGFFYNDIQPDNVFFLENASGLTRALFIDPGNADPVAAGETDDPTLALVEAFWAGECEKLRR